MGALCCCLSSDNSFEDYLPYQNGSVVRECPCFRSCLPWFFNTQYSASFDEVEHQETVSTSGSGGGGGAGSVGGSSFDNSMVPEVFQAPPTPLPYDSDPRYLRHTHDELVSRRDKSRVSQEPVRHSHSDGGGTALHSRSGGDDLDEVKSGRDDKNAPPSKAFPRVESALSMLDDDDICPTCLDGYVEENPRITTACGHNYHLSCIYEWMERSNRCPVCDKEMIFSESS